MTTSYYVIIEVAKWLGFHYIQKVRFSCEMLERTPGPNFAAQSKTKLL